MGIERKRILVLIKGLGLGGAERLIAEAARFWDRESFDYSVAYILPWKDNLVGSLQEAGIVVTCIGGKKGMSALTPLSLRRHVSSLRPDLIHAHLPSAGIVARVSTSTPVVYTEHNIAASYRLPTRLLNRLTYRWNDAVIAVSEPVAGSLDRYPGPAPIVIPNGIYAEAQVDVDSVRAELGASPTTPLVVHVGNIRPHKGHSNLIAATALLVDSIPDVLVVSAGAEKHPGDLERVRQEAERAGVAGNLRFLGRREDARRLLAAADVVVNPSDFEGLPVTLLEALSFARPVVATDVGGVPNIVQHERTGLLVPPGDPGALSKALERALTDPASRGWGDNGKILVERDHSIETMVREYEDLYRSVLGA